MIFENKEKAKIALEKITSFVNEKLDMQFNSKTQIIKGIQGVNFCGYKINEYRLKIRDRGKRNLKKKVKMLTNKVKLGKIADVYNLTSKLFYNGDVYYWTKMSNWDRCV